MLNSYLELNFEVLHPATNNRYVNGNDIKLVNLGPIALISNYLITTSSGKQLGKIDHAPIVSLRYKLLTSSRGSDVLSTGLDRSRIRGRDELTNNKNIKGKYHLRIYLKDNFGWAQFQEKGTYELGFKLTLTRNTDNAVLKKDNAINNSKIRINAIEWYVPHYTLSLDQYRVLMKQIVDKTPLKLRYPERHVLMKEVSTQIFRIFELGTQESISIPIWIITVFRQTIKI